MQSAVGIVALALAIAATGSVAVGHPPRVHPDQHIWAADADRDYVRHLTHGRGSHYEPLWSPDGRRAALFVYHSAHGIFYARPALMTRTGRITRTFYESADEPDLIGWSPDGRWLLIRELHDTGSDTPAFWDRWLVTLNVATGERHVLTRHVHASEELPGAGWSPDSRRVAFVPGNEGRRLTENPLLSVAVDGRDRRVLADRASYFEDWGKRGVYYDVAGPERKENPYKPHELRVVSGDGGPPRTVLSSVSKYGGLSPDGDWLVYRRRHPGGIWLARADGSDRRRISRPRYRFGWAPGDRGAYVLDARLRLFPVSGGEHDIGRVNYGPIAWSPDGRWIAWERGQRTIAVMDEHGRHRHVVVRAPWDTEVGLDGWLPGSSTLLFITGQPPD